MTVVVAAFSVTVPLLPLLKTGALSLRSTVIWKALDAADWGLRVRSVCLAVTL